MAPVFIRDFYRSLDPAITTPVDVRCFFALLALGHFCSVYFFNVCLRAVNNSGLGVRFELPIYTSKKVDVEPLEPPVSGSTRYEKEEGKS